MRILINIAARGGSKGVSNKNIRPLMGKPLLCYTIEQALRWGRASRVIVSTDSRKIADVARGCGAEVPFMRPGELATDTAPKLPVLRHALRECERIYSETYDLVVDLDPTSPVRKLEDLNACLEKFLRDRPYNLFSVVHAHKNPYFNIVEEKPDGFVKLCKELPEGVYTRQSAPMVYALNASIYIYDREFLLDDRNTFVVSDRSSYYVMPDISGYDIDREIDFEFIEFLIAKGRISLD